MPHSQLLAYLSLFVGLAGLYLFTLSPTVTTAYGGADGGELATAVALGGVAHPPGYPTYLLLGRVALLLPGGEVAGRLAALNALCLALAASVLAATIVQLPTAAAPGPRLLAASVAALSFGLDRRIWEQALIVEVYAAATLFLALLLWLTARWWRWHAPQTLAAAGLVLGLGLGIQLPLAAWLVGAVAVWGADRRRTWRGAATRSDTGWIKTMGPFVALLLLGLSVYALLPWRGRAVPQASWGDWRTLDGALDHITAREYTYLADIVPWNVRLSRVSYALRDLVGGLGWLGSGLALAGVLGAGAALRRWGWLLGGIAGATLLWATSYGGADGAVYLLPLHLIGAFYAGVGALLALAWLERHAPGRWRWTLVVPLALVVLALLQAPSISLRDITADRDRALAWLQAAPPAGTITTQADADTFPLWYAQKVLGVRPDVTIIDTRLCDRRWYRVRCR
ncbi:MAG: DUF2723 domain-containing protein [Herpetosiphonaceae bacterium]|nr:DUF2723 domain-containing protein [Herpetosiphonaceae bacterium]